MTQNSHKQFKTIEEYFSFVRHELKGKLAVIKEGISQPLEEFEKNNALKPEDAELLRIALYSADKMNMMISDLLQPDQFSSLVLK